MKDVLLICAIFLGYTLCPLDAGYVVSISDGREMTGKLSLTSSSVQVSTDTSPTDINFSEVLEAEFGDTPFQLNFYSSNGAKGTQFPPNWKEQDIGEVDAPGSGSIADGVVILSGSGNFSKQKRGTASDRCFFAGQPWIGDGQFTLRIKDIDAQSLNTSAGIMLRDSLDASAADACLETTSLGGGLFACRLAAGGLARPTIISITPPAWLRLTRFGMRVFAAVSTDKQQWDLVGQADFKSFDSPWVGLYSHTKREKEQGKATFDDVTFTPAPSSADIIPPGVLLVGGSFVAASCEHLQFDPNNPDTQGNFLRNGTAINMSASQISAITMLPLTRAQIADLGSHLGLLMKNGDAMDGDIASVNAAGVNVNSVLLGITTYDRTAVRACVLHPLQPQPAKYVIRLRDGSAIHAADVSVSGDSIVINDVSGVKIAATLGEVAQFRAGSAQVQSLAEIAWKATPAPPLKNAPATAPAVAAPAPAPAPAPANGAPPAAPVIAPAPADANPEPLVGSWGGPDEEQVLATAAGTKIDFPLTGKFRAMAMRIMIASDSPPNAQATVHIIADGREIATTPAFKAGDQPRFVQVILQNPKTLTLVADSPYEGTKLLYIDPVVIRN